MARDAYVCDNPACIVCGPKLREGDIRALLAEHRNRRARERGDVEARMPPWLRAVETPLIKHLGMSLYRCRCTLFGQTVDGFGSNPTHAWNAWCDRVGGLLLRHQNPET